MKLSLTLCNWKAEKMLAQKKNIDYRMIFKEFCSRFMERNWKISITAEAKFGWRGQASLKHCTCLTYGHIKSTVKYAALISKCRGILSFICMKKDIFEYTIHAGNGKQIKVMVSFYIIESNNWFSLNSSNIIE